MISVAVFEKVVVGVVVVVDMLVVVIVVIVLDFVKAVVEEIIVVEDLSWNRKEYSGQIMATSEQSGTPTIASATGINTLLPLGIASLIKHC